MTLYIASYTSENQTTFLFQPNKLAEKWETLDNKSCDKSAKILSKFEKEHICLCVFLRFEIASVGFTQDEIFIVSTFSACLEKHDKIHCIFRKGASGSLSKRKTGAGRRRGVGRLGSRKRLAERWGTWRRREREGVRMAWEGGGWGMCWGYEVEGILSGWSGRETEEKRSMTRNIGLSKVCKKE